MALEEFDITKDNIAKDSFLSLLANVSEQYNILLKKETVTLEDTTKILSQIMEAYSFYNTIKQSELTQELSDARIQLNEIATTFQNLEQFKGDKGDSFEFSDFTPEQLLSLKGDKGDKFLYSDFTPEQLLSLKGVAGTTDYNNLDNKPDLSNLSDSGWVSLIPYLANGWLAYSSSYRCHYRKIGNIVFINALVKSGTSANIFSLPPEIRPLFPIIFRAGAVSNISSFSGVASDYINLSINGSLDFSGFNTSYSSIVISYLLK
jgi:hypothetical protein